MGLVLPEVRQYHAALAIPAAFGRPGHRTGSTNSALTDPLQQIRWRRKQSDRMPRLPGQLSDIDRFFPEFSVFPVFGGRVDDFAISGNTRLGDIPWA
jgi:hypothetical protein